MVTFVAVTLANQFYEEFLDVPAFTRRVLISREINAVKPIGHFRVLKIAAKRRKERKKIPRMDTKKNLTQRHKGAKVKTVGFTRKSYSNAKFLGLMPFLDHEMVQQNSPGL
jgi:hypothetical protein